MGLSRDFVVASSRTSCNCTFVLEPVTYSCDTSVSGGSKWCRPPPSLRWSLIKNSTAGRSMGGRGDAVWQIVLGRRKFIRNWFYSAWQCVSACAWSNASVPGSNSNGTFGESSSLFNAPCWVSRSLSLSDSIHIIKSRRTCAAFHSPSSSSSSPYSSNNRYSHHSCILLLLLRPCRPRIGPSRRTICLAIPSPAPSREA